MRVTEIFESIQGETTQAGCPNVFVRFTGCDLRCKYCDTTFAYEGGVEYSIGEIVNQLAGFSSRSVTLTGGEPMLQSEVPGLCSELIKEGWKVSVETNGQRSLVCLPSNVSRIVDVKTPGSGCEDQAFINLRMLRPGDEVKFVLTSEFDFWWSVQVCRRFGLESKVPILLSPVVGQVDPKILVRWLLGSGLQARINLQIHKIIWGADVRGV